MNRSRCECEREVLDALRTGSWSAELRAHIESCVPCGETKQVAESLLLYAASLRTNRTAVDQIWRRAQAQRQAMILKRATRPLIFMRVLSLGCVIAFAAWLLPGFSRFDYREIDILHGWALGGILPGVTIAVLCVAVGAFYLLHEGKQQVVFDVVS